MSDEKPPLPKRPTDGTSDAAQAGRNVKNSTVTQTSRG